MPRIGFPELAIILVIALIIFGPGKLPSLGKSVGETIKEFKKASSELMNDNKKEAKSDVKKTETEEDVKAQETKAEVKVEETKK
ncbi:twin-arginine translocase TatA/TatE family subunit [Clostridium algoriphilum]|uniref:twin-arginine translocase TatA/TatE family subunit n=1 Tax=Clostridium algoriphilum TaxID=198347 RepID=UPI001CF147BC|nr:twin-arginine translocase TatA/TatE family subunit [Clostridium algoriphilum]MCB2295525.1 twin-arginine translocase TatA/TatE family subunit [Clostridium algoriphilum]